MSNGTLAELPKECMPHSFSLHDNAIPLPDDGSVMLLLPHNKYLLGTGGDNWLYGKLGLNPNETVPQNVYLYDNEGLSLMNEGDRPTILTPGTVNELLRALTRNAPPPGRHSAAILMLRTMMRGHAVFVSDDSDFMDEKVFARFMEHDEILKRAYWTTRFALARGEMEIVRRLKSWLKVGPLDRSAVKLWFSIQDIPDEDALEELKELSFSDQELRRMSAQNISPLVLYNPRSGWLILGRFGRTNGREIMFSVWVYLNHEIWQELRDRQKLAIQDIINAVWGEYDTKNALNERAKYR